LKEKLDHDRAVQENI
jgi:hypothetical protein